MFNALKRMLHTITAALITLEHSRIAIFVFIATLLKLPDFAQYIKIFIQLL